MTSIALARSHRHAVSFRINKVALGLALLAAIATLALALAITAAVTGSLMFALTAAAITMTTGYVAFLKVISTLER